MDYKTRCSPQRFFRVVRELNIAKQEAVKELGFGGLLKIKGIQLRHILCGWLMARCDSQKKTIKINEQDIPVTAWDVHCIIGLPHEGEPVELRDNVPIEPHLLPYYDVKGRHISVSHLENLIKGSDHVDDNFKRTFVLFAIATLLAPKCRLEISEQYLPLLADTKRISKYAWGRYVVDYLFSEIGKVKEGGNKWMQGCLVFLQYWYYEHIRLPGAPFDFESRTYPLLAHWDEKRCKQRDQYEGINGGYGKGDLRMVLTKPDDEEPLNQDYGTPDEHMDVKHKMLLTLSTDVEPLNQISEIPHEHTNFASKRKKRKIRAPHRKVHMEEEDFAAEILRSHEVPADCISSRQHTDTVTTLVRFVGNMEKHMVAMGKQMAKQTCILEEISHKLDCKDQVKTFPSPGDFAYTAAPPDYAEGDSSFQPPQKTIDVPNGQDPPVK